MEVPTHFGVTGGFGIVWKSIVFDAAFVYTSGKDLYGEYDAGLSEVSSTKIVGSIILRF